MKDFIEKHAKKYGDQLKVTYTHGSYPRLRLKGADGWVGDRGSIPSGGGLDLAGYDTEVRRIVTMHKQH